MRWAKIAKLSAVLAVLTTVALGALPAAHWIKSELRARAERPDPVVATSEETRAILGVVLDHMKFGGVPPPPPEPGESPRPHPTRILILADQSLCFGETPAQDCASESGDRLLIPELEPLAPQKLRAELVAANQTPHDLDLSGIPGTKVVRSSVIQEMFREGWWDDFYRSYPDTSGFARISRPVLTMDRQQALIYIAHRCDGLCGSGSIHLLVRSGSGWRIVKTERVWIS